MDRMTTIVALTIDQFDNDGGGETKTAVIIDGERYRVVKLRRGAVVPRRQLLSSSSLYHSSECAVRVSVNIGGSAVVEAGWMSTSVHVAIKEMSWELVGEHRSTLAENPIKEIATMQYH